METTTVETIEESAPEAAPAVSASNPLINISGVAVAVMAVLLLAYYWTRRRQAAEEERLNDELVRHRIRAESGDGTLHDRREHYTAQLRTGNRPGED